MNRSKRNIPLSRPIVLFCVAVLAALILVMAVVPSAFAFDNEELYFLTLINNYRASNGLPPLALSNTLSNASRGHSADMAINNYFSHTGSDGSSFSDRIRAAGYGYNTYLGENIAAGFTTAQSVFDAWRNSAPHNANMLNGNFHAIGISRVYGPNSQYGWYWTTDFGGISDGGVYIPPFRLITDASNPTGVFFLEGSTKRAVPAAVYNSWGFARYPIEYIDHASFISFTTGSDLSKLASANGGVYFIDRGGKRAIPDLGTFNVWGFDWNQVTPVSTATINSLASMSNLSILIQPEGSSGVYLVDNKTRHPLASPDLLQHFGYPAIRDVSVVSGDFPLSDAASISNFTVMGSGPAQYVMGSGRKMLIPSAAVANLWNLGSATYATLADSTIGGLASGPDLSGLGQTYGQGGVFLMEAGSKRPIVDYDTFVNWGFSEGAIFTVGSQVSGSFANGAPLTRLMSYSGSTYIVQGGVKQELVNFATLSDEALWHYGLLRSDVQPAAASTFNLLGSGNPITLISSNLVFRNGRNYLIDSGVRHAFRDSATFTSWGFNPGNVIAPFYNRGIDSYPEGAPLTPLASNAGGVYLVQNGSFRPIFDGNTLNIFKDNWGLGWGDIVPVSDSLRASMPLGGAITFPRLVTYSNGGPVYYMDSDGKRPIQNAPTFEHWGFQWGDIFYTKNNAFLAGYPSPAPLSVLALEKRPDGSLGGVYLIANGAKHPIACAQSFNNHATFDPVFNWNNIFPVSTATLATLPDGNTIY